MRMRERVDSRNVDLSQNSALRRYTRAFGCTEQQLRAAVAALGTEVIKLRQQFRRRPMVRHRRHAG